MLKVNVYSLKGTKMEDFALPKEFDQEVNMKLLSQANRVYEVLSHVGYRKAQTRSEVNRTHKKVYKQKGTGGARHGSKNAPIFVGGGVAHGPRPIKREISLSKNMKVLSKSMAISLKAKNSAMVLLDGVNKIQKTKEVFQVLKKISKENGSKKFVFASSETNLGSLMFFRNLKDVTNFSFRNINSFNILKGGLLVVDKAVFTEAKPEAKKEAKELKVEAKKETKKKVVKKVVKKTVKKAKKS